MHFAFVDLVVPPFDQLGDILSMDAVIAANSHGAKFVVRERHAVSAQSILPKNDWSGRGELDRYDSHEHQRRQEDHERGRTAYVDDSLDCQSP